MSSGGGQMSIAQYLIFVAPFFVTVLVVFGMKCFSAIFQARARLANDALYRTLAAIRSDLTRFAGSLATVEKILQQVE